MRVQRNVVVMLVLASLVGCGIFGSKARDNVLEPAMLLAGEGIRMDAMFGVGFLPTDEQAAAEANVTEFFASVEARDNLALVQWPIVRQYAMNGIQAMVDQGTIGTLGAASRTERLDQYHAALIKLFGVGG